MYSGAGGITTEDKEMTQDVLSRFNNYVVNDGLSPENAYLKVIAKIAEIKFQIYIHLI